MKKNSVILLVCLLVISMISTRAIYADTFSVYSCVESQMASPPIYIIGPYDENSNDGYVLKSDPINGQYYVRVRESRLIQGPADNDPVVDAVNFGYVYRTDNFTASLSQSKTISTSVQRSVTFTSEVATTLGVSLNLGDASTLGNEVTSTHSTVVSQSVGTTVSETYAQGYSYGFPINTAPANCTKAKRSAGFQYETYRSIIDVKKLVPVSKYHNIVAINIREMGEICYTCGAFDCFDHTHDHGLICEYDFTLANGAVITVPDTQIDSLIADGILTPNMSQYYGTFNEWKREVVEGTVKLPVPVLVTVYFDQYGNILDQDGNII